MVEIEREGGKKGGGSNPTIYEWPLILSYGIISAMAHNHPSSFFFVNLFNFF